MQPETRIINATKTAIKRRWPDAKVVKIHGNAYQEAGLPDLFILNSGALFVFEAKVEGNYPTKLQETQLDDFERAGAIAAVIRSAGQAVNVIDQYPIVRRRWRVREDDYRTSIKG